MGWREGCANYVSGLAISALYLAEYISTTSWASSQSHRSYEVKFLRPLAADSFHPPSHLEHLTSTSQFLY